VETGLPEEKKRDAVGGFAQTVSFSGPMNFPVGIGFDNPWSVAVGDFNGDGK
jgi:FG-GAP repeat